ncbi:MAG: S8 family serine peptidase [Sandaracinaceae bacterium]|nr:S8 family serine peptidase [Sandaracinaceae bacterium]
MRERWPALVVLLAAATSSAHAQLPPRWPRAPLIEVARAAVGADAARERYAVSGRGSTLCLVDTGVDEVALGAERVRWVWDASGPPRGHALEAIAGGAVYAPGEASDSRGDAHGHGTAMAAVAAGPDGLAPDARLVVAAAWSDAREGFEDDAVVEGVRFCRAVAALDDAIDERTMVILLSLGGHDGDHGGEGAFERALVRAAGPVPVVVAAGNDGERPVRAAGRLFAGELGVVTLGVPRPAREDAALRLTVRHEGAAWLVAPSGARARLAAGAFALDGALVTVEPRDAARSVTLASDAAPLAAGTWRVELEGPSRFEVWLAGARLGDTFFPVTLGGAHVVEDETITIPATAPELIAVGATIARPRVGERGSLGEPGEVAPFSSRGPTPGGALAPALVAPGGWILAPLSSDVRLTDRANLIGGRAELVVDGRVAVRGSSAAAAVVAGALLLALELDPEMGREARARLVASTAEAGWTPSRGFGALDVERLLARLAGASSDRVELVASRVAFEPGEAVWVAVRADADGVRLRVDGEEQTLSLAGGAAFARLWPRAPRPRVEAFVDGAALPPLELAPAPDRRRPYAPAGGGCTASPPRSRPAAPAALLVLLFVRFGPRRGMRGA